MSKIKGIRIYFPTEKEAVPPYFDNLNSTLTGFATKYEISAGELADITAHNTNLAALLLAQEAAQNAAQQATQAFNEAIAAAELDAKRIFKKIMQHRAFVRSDGEAMGFLVESPSINLTTVKPVISKVTPMINKIVIDWVKAGMEGVVIFCAKRSVESSVISDETLTTKSSEDDHSGLTVQPVPEVQYEEIGRDFRSPFEDTRPNLSNFPEFRQYKLCYLNNDQIVGLESDIIKIIAEIYER